ncbi:hypothetical protein DNFV4_03719 [Nitrospira tepida]|uniref:Uncharacterized protein n=1 Tax=Nitrospira tepida TaxID=2973512 RepID=A0AA86N222_9BACT|nr:hypothetical protein DNFV4_03719 [Nitrospira tepida]
MLELFAYAFMGGTLLVCAIVIFSFLKAIE